MLRIDRNLYSNLSMFKMLMEGSVVDPEFLPPILEELGKHAQSSLPLNVPSSYVGELHRAYLGEMMFADEAPGGNDCPIAVVARAAGMPYLSGVDGMSIAPSQWTDVYRVVDAEIHTRLPGYEPQLDASKNVSDFDAAARLFHDSRLFEFMYEVERKGVLWVLSAHIVRCVQSLDPVDLALLQLAIATAMQAHDADVIAVCAFLHVASLVQAKGIRREVAEVLVNRVVDVAKCVYNTMSGGAPFNAVSSAIAHLICVNNKNESDSLFGGLNMS
eukprot:jgi/Mesvir1/18494/Mv14339-RA.1